LQPQCVDRHLVGARVGLVRFDLIGAENMFKDILKVGVLDTSIEYRPGRIGQQGKPNASFAQLL